MSSFENHGIKTELTQQEKLASLTLIFNPAQKLQFLNTCRLAKESQSIKQLQEICRTLEEKSKRDLIKFYTLIGISHIGIIGSVEFLKYNTATMTTLITIFVGLNLPNLAIALSQQETEKLKNQANEKLLQLKKNLVRQ
jgi:hypothetical protein